jgi:hypothetical protein
MYCKHTGLEDVTESVFDNYERYNKIYSMDKGDFKSLWQCAEDKFKLGVLQDALVDVLNPELWEISGAFEFKFGSITTSADDEPHKWIKVCLYRQSRGMDGCAWPRCLPVKSTKKESEAGANSTAL